MPDEPISCLICSDSGEIGRVLRVLSPNSALVMLHSREAEVAIDLVPDAKTGDKLLIHLDVAIALVEANESRGDAHRG
ncbi:MAG: HypC/HybG/HupF family hydrogenase formation chaperone [Armatimonadetes bacterium]|nr:HypC/HybG/HupF family hydrogenase formation chaperone [Armatimonadota bacterium]